MSRNWLYLIPVGGAVLVLCLAYAQPLAGVVGRYLRSVRMRRAQREAELWHCSECGTRLYRRNMTDSERRTAHTLVNGSCPRPHYLTSIPGAAPITPTIKARLNGA